MSSARSASRGRLGTWIGAGALAVALLVVAVAIYLYRWGPQPVASPVPVAAAPVAVEPESPVPVGSALVADPDLPPETLLPAIDESDLFVRELVSELSSHPQIARWLVTDDLIRRFAAAVANVSLGDSPSPHLGFLAPSEGFAVSEGEGGVYVAPRSYARYDLFADAFVSLDEAGTASLYATLRPLIGEAYRDLGYADDFDDALALAVESLLEVPVLQGRVPVSRLVMTYEYGDPELEGLDTAQRHFLRMGARNVRAVQDKLRKLIPALGISLAP